MLSEAIELESGIVGCGIPDISASGEANSIWPNTAGYGDWLIPGVGKRFDDHCGKWASVYACPHDHKHEVIPFKNSCDSRECPICFGEWVKREVDRADDRITGYLKLVRGLGGSYRLSHWVFSPCDVPDDLDIEGFRKLRKHAYAVIGNSGVRAGVVVFHAYRSSERAKIEHRTALSNGYRGGRWDWLRENNLLLNRDYVEWGPHFHVLGTGWSVNGDVTFERSGWIQKRIGSVEPDHVRKLMRYELGHASWIDTGFDSVHSLTYCGEMSVPHMRVARSREKYGAGCSVCGCRLERFEDWVVTDNGTVDMSHALRTGSPLIMTYHKTFFWFVRYPDFRVCVPGFQHRKCEWMEPMPKGPPKGRGNYRIDHEETSPLLPYDIFPGFCTEEWEEIPEVIVDA